MIAFGATATIAPRWLYLPTRFLLNALRSIPVEALTATGALQRQVITYSVVPQVSPMLISYSLLLFEGNVRGATILGLVGAGGMELTTALRLYDHGHVFAIVLSIIVLVRIIDLLSVLIRKR